MRSSHWFVAAWLAMAAAHVAAEESRLEKDNASEQTEQALDTVTSLYPMRSGAQNTWQTEAMTPGKETGDLLRDLLGVAGSRMGGHGTDPVIRGLGQNRINVVMDGAMIQGACPNRMDPPSAYAPTSGYDTITVTRGIASLARAAGPGGTIVFERNTEPFLSDEPVRFEAHGGYRHNGRVSDAAFDLSAGQPLGYVRLLGSTMDAQNYTDGANQPVRSAFEDHSIAWLLGYTPDDDAEIVLSLDAQRLRDSLFAGAGMDSPWSDSDTFRIRGQLNERGPFDRISFEAYHASVDHLMDNYSLRRPPSPMMRLAAPSSSKTTGVNLKIDQGPWQWGIDATRNDREAVRNNVAMGTLNSVLWPDVTIERAGVFAQWSHRSPNDASFITGWRVDQTRSEAGDVDRQPPGMALSPNQLYQRYNGLVASKRQDTHLSFLARGELGIELAGVPNMRLYGAFSQTWRDADATERFIASNGMMPSRRWVGNPGLHAERHRQVEVGAFSQDIQWDFDFSIYRNEVDDFILRTRFHELGNNATIYRNVQAMLWGSELAMGYRFNNGWYSGIEFAYVYGQNETDDRPLAQMPPLAVTARLSYETDAWQTGLIWRGATKQTRVDDDPMLGSGLDARQTPGWAVLDLYAQWQLNAQWRLDLGVDNLFDRLYAQHLNRASAFDAMQVQVNEPGRSAWLRLSYRR